MKLITLNLEGDRHLDVAIPFLERERADVVCLQEVFERDAQLLSETLGLSMKFCPMTRRPSFTTGGELMESGIALLSRTIPSRIESFVYYARSKDIMPFDRSTPESIDATMQRVVLIATVEEVSIATTHFNWTPNGLESDEQRVALAELTSVLAPYQSLILCGDFNIPRSVNALYAKLITHFDDCIPRAIAGSIDVARHRVKDEPEIAGRLSHYMVDYILSRGAYSVSHVRQVCGVSDHCAFVAEVTAKPA